MKSAHVDASNVHTVVDEHRVVIDLTVLEAALFLRDQPIVLREIRARVRKALNGCDSAPRGEEVG